MRPDEKRIAERVLQKWVPKKWKKKDEDNIEHLKLKYCMIIAVVLISAITIIVVAIVIAIVFTTKKNSGESREGPVVSDTASKFHYTLVCPGPEVEVYLTKERQEVILEGVTNVDGRPIPSLEYRPVIFDDSAEYAAPSKFIITRKSVGKEFPVDVNLKDVDGTMSQCSYKILVKGK